MRTGYGPMMRIARRGRERTYAPHVLYRDRTAECARALADFGGPSRFLELLLRAVPMLAKDGSFDGALFENEAVKSCQAICRWWMRAWSKMSKLRDWRLTIMG